MPGLTERDRRVLGELASGEIHPNQIQNSTTSPTAEVPDWDSQNKYISQKLSEYIVDYAERHTNADAADHFGISERTVERHRAGDVDFDPTRISSSMCTLMREFAHDDEPLSQIAAKMDVSKGAAHRHVTGDCQHENVEAVDLTRGIENCDHLRKMAHRGMSSNDIKAETGYSRDAINTHVSANRECSCDNEVEPICY